MLLLNRGGRIPRREDGGEVGGLQPSAQSENPLVSNQFAQFAAMSPEKLREMAVRISPNSEAGTLLRKALEQRSVMPQQDSQLQAGFARGGSILRRYADGSAVDDRDFSGDMPSWAQDNSAPTSQFSQQVQDDAANEALRNIAAKPTKYGIPPISGDELNSPEKSNVIPFNPPQSGLGTPQNVAANPVDNAKLSITPQVDDIGPAPTIHQPVQAESPDLGQALMQAGFAMMAGRSPHALENIGAGAMSGM